MKDGRPDNDRKNGEIRAKAVRVIGPTGAMLGIMLVGQALSKAAEYGMDLVEIAPEAQPPICKIIPRDDDGEFASVVGGRQ